jgi:hypothetical protein
MLKFTNCRSCGAKIVFLLTQKGRNIPVNPNLDKPEHKVRDNDMYLDTQRHISHFATCPNASKHRKSKTKISVK